LAAFETIGVFESLVRLPTPKGHVALQLEASVAQSQLAAGSDLEPTILGVIHFPSATNGLTSIIYVLLT
jgi:hypothetical protein